MRLGFVFSVIFLSAPEDCLVMYFYRPSLLGFELGLYADVCSEKPSV